MFTCTTSHVNKMRVCVSVVSLNVERDMSEGSTAVDHSFSLDTLDTRKPLLVREVVVLALRPSFAAYLATSQASALKKQLQLGGTKSILTVTYIDIYNDICISIIYMYIYIYVGSFQMSHT